VPNEANLDVGGLSARQPGRGVAVAHGLALASAGGLIVLTAGSDRWSLWPLTVIVVFTVIGDLTSVEAFSPKLKVSGSFLGIMLAAVLLGSGPAALVGTASIAAGWLRWREAPHYLRNNLVTFIWFPVIGGVFFHTAVGLAGVGPKSVAYYLLVFAAFMLAMTLNFLLVVGYQCYLDGSSLARRMHEALAPIMAGELFSALLTLVAVYVDVRVGTVGLAMFGLVLIVFQYLVGELLVSKRRSNELQRLATTDELTGLANRAHLRARIAERLEGAGLEAKPFAVLLIDLDRFKEINDTLGHHYGDALLGQMGARLAAHVGASGLVARLGGDEFVVLAEIREPEGRTLGELATQLVACVEQPFAIDEASLDIGASVGIARYPLDGHSANELLRRADVAMYAAKEAQSGFKLYAPELDHHSVRRLGLMSNVRRALAEAELVVHYQPKVHLDDLRVAGTEALVRWQHPDLGLLPPAAFIPAVEQTNLIGPLTRYVLERSIEQCAAWRDDTGNLSVAVNLSVRNLLDRDLPRDIEGMLSMHGLPPEALRLEITESMIMSDPDRALANLGRLNDLGIRLSVDDFGTGHSSLANLKRLPIHQLKIDRSFVSRMLEDQTDLIIVRSTINLAHDLGLTVVAEGVEDELTLERLAQFGCDQAQGYYLSRPLPPEALGDWLTNARVPDARSAAA
jgi:diguanylate cyclase (GGDEF)-like protein